MSKVQIIQNGREKTVPAAHAKILVALKKATYPQTEEPKQANDSKQDEAAKPAKREYKRKDLKAE